MSSIQRRRLYLALCAFSLGTASLANAAQVRGDSVVFSARKKEMIAELPAVDVPPNLSYSAQGIRVFSEFTVPADVWIHGYEIQLFDCDGNRITTPLLHHITIIAPELRELFSPVMLRVAAAGAETGKVRVKDWIGMPMRKGSTFTVNAMLQNPTAHEIHGLRVRVVIAATSQRRNPDAMAAYPFHVHAGSGLESGPDFDLPVGVSMHTWEGKPAVSGKLVGLGGHLHNYGTALRFEDVTTGEVLFASVADYDSTGAVMDVRRSEFDKRAVKIHADHTYRVTATYNNPTGQPIARGGMGIVGGMIIPAGRNAWPAADETDALLVADRDRQPKEMLAKAEHQHH